MLHSLAADMDDRGIRTVWDAICPEEPHSFRLRVIRESLRIVVQQRGRSLTRDISGAGFFVRLFTSSDPPGRLLWGRESVRCLARELKASAVDETVPRTSGPQPDLPIEAAADNGREWRDEVLPRILRLVHPDAHHWLHPARQIGRRDRTLMLRVPDLVTLDYFEHEYRAPISTAAEEAGYTITLTVEASEQSVCDVGTAHPAAQASSSTDGSFKTARELLLPVVDDLKSD